MNNDSQVALFDHLNDNLAKNEQRRPPWTWSLRTQHERDALAGMIAEFVACFNTVYASDVEELIPPCWPHHPALATELAVHIWLWYEAHHDSGAGTGVSGDYYLRHLPGLRSRIAATLGRSPSECRQGQHPDSWRTDVDALIHQNEPTSRHADGPAPAIERLTRIGFGF
ncbi:hypothetical protein [Alloactinosynnema sp. L-07]|uniref:hypothetical protein n=1 Tax=Alloactinosynnema sp. L-07 TaxID=1653480 RepID=UPI00065EF22B|nr:hypothetical protein [Alloactinosynnema sp. L-07]CRK59270.1 hypothetical protein [Alloactinosynnema sp. L-07]